MQKQKLCVWITVHLPMHTRCVVGCPAARPGWGFGPHQPSWSSAQRPMAPRSPQRPGGGVQPDIQKGKNDDWKRCQPVRHIFGMLQQKLKLPPPPRNLSPICQPSGQQSPGPSSFGQPNGKFGCSAAPKCHQHQCEPCSEKLLPPCMCPGLTPPPGFK